MIATVILKEDVAHLEVTVIPMVADRVALIRGSGNVSNVGEIIIFLRSAERNLVVLNGHSWLMLTLPFLVILLIFMLLQSLTLVLLALPI